MPEIRTERVTVSLTPALVERLDQFARERHWTRSTAIAILIESGLAESQNGETP